MAKKLRIGIVGCGAIGTSLAKTIVNQFAGQARLVCFYDIDKNKALLLAASLKKDGFPGLHSIVSFSLDNLIQRTGLVIEAAQAKSSLAIARSVLRKGRDVMVMSVGGIAAHINQLRQLAKSNQAKLYIPSGAICGIDAIKAASQRKIRKVILLTRKNPNSFGYSDYLKKRGIKLDKIKKDTILFSGAAREAIKLFPQNINVAATLSIAGIGAARTRVKIMACPKVKRNIHEIYIESDAGVISTRVENLVHPDNPKTSFLAVLSAIATLRQILDPVRIGT
ncbi:MAG: aspartate dehydrogenase [Candidatus Omnitrophota bacterium]